MHKHSIVFLAEGLCSERRMGCNLITNLTNWELHLPTTFFIQCIKDRFFFVLNSVLGQYSCAHTVGTTDYSLLVFLLSKLAVNKSLSKGIPMDPHTLQQCIRVRQNMWVSSWVTVFSVQNSLFVLLSLSHSSARKRQVRRHKMRESHGKKGSN